MNHGKGSLRRLDKLGRESEKKGQYMRNYEVSGLRKQELASAVPKTHENNDSQRDKRAKVKQRQSKNRRIEY